MQKDRQWLTDQSSSSIYQTCLTGLNHGHNTVNVTQRYIQGYWAKTSSPKLKPNPKHARPTHSWSIMI